MNVSVRQAVALLIAQGATKGEPIGETAYKVCRFIGVYIERPRLGDEPFHSAMPTFPTVGSHDA